MLSLRLSTIVSVLSLCSCSLQTAPVPEEFKLSLEALGQQYPAARSTGIARLFAHEILTTRDEFGRETHLASGGALLVKKYADPIQAKAVCILITPDYSEVRGKSIVKKGDRLYLGQDDSAKIVIDGVQIKPEGACLVRAVAPEEAKPSPASPAESVPAGSDEKQIEPTPPVKESVVAKSKVVPKPKTKPSSVASKTKSSTSDPKAKPLPASDRAALLKLMREPTER